MLMAQNKGFSLLVGLIFLSVLTILGVNAARIGSFQEKASSNLHLYNYTFSAAASGVELFSEMANDGDDVNDIAHVLFRARHHKSIDFCIDELGNEILCPSGFFDKQNTKVELDVVNKGCVQQMCFGYSVSSSSGGVKCLFYQIESSSDGNGLSETVELWAYQVSAQC